AGGGPGGARRKGRMGGRAARPGYVAKRNSLRGDAMIGFAIVGCGMIARFHARALADVPDTRVVALVSRKAANARNLAESLGLSCDVYTELAPVLARPDVQVVIVTTPSGAHLAPAVAAARAGKDVVVW